MTPAQTRLDHIDGRWRVMAKRAQDGSGRAVWLSLGSCASRKTAFAVWLALVSRGN